jgi:uncharacterized membrane protein YfcA
VDGLLAVVVIALATLVGATIQGSIGFGMNLVTVPVLALVLPEALPATAILLGIPISLAMLRHEHHAIDRSGLGWIIAGRIPGTLVGTWIVATFTADGLKGFIGASVLLAVALSIFTPPLRLTPPAQVAGGAASGMTGTAAGIGGPPIALLYQHHPGPTMRATLAASFFFGTLLSITSLGFAHEVRGADILIALALIPIIISGSALGRLAHSTLDRKWLRPAVLMFAAVSALVVIATALW